MIASETLLSLDLPTMRRAAAHEAIDRLGLLTADAAEVIIALLADARGLHPRRLCAEYRRRGLQIDAAQKKVLGMRKNGALSLEALAHLTPAGRRQPVTAHETVLLRAGFSVARQTSVRSFLALVDQRALSPSALVFTYDFAARDCPGCKTLDGAPVEPRKAAIFPPPDCACPAPGYAIQAHVDWLAEVD